MTNYAHMTGPGWMSAPLRSALSSTEANRRMQNELAFRLTPEQARQGEMLASMAPGLTTEQIRAAEFQALRDAQHPHAQEFAGPTPNVYAPRARPHFDHRQNTPPPSSGEIWHASEFASAGTPAAPEVASAGTPATGGYTPQQAQAAFKLASLLTPAPDAPPQRMQAPGILRGRMPFAGQSFLRGSLPTGQWRPTGFLQ